MCMLVSAWLQTTRPNCRPGPRIVLEPGSRSRSNLNYSRGDEQNAQFGQCQSAEVGSATSPFIKLTTHCIPFIHFSSRLPPPGQLVECRTHRTHLQFKLNAHKLVVFPNSAATALTATTTTIPTLQLDEVPSLQSPVSSPLCRWQSTTWAT